MPDLVSGRALEVGSSRKLVFTAARVRRFISNILVVAAATYCAPVALAAELRNWFNDPFFQLSSAVRNCPTPLGPLMTEEDSRQQAHHRAERGTTCWLAGQCDKPNAFAYDQAIASELRTRLADLPVVRSATLWITVQGRVVYIEGCARDASAVRELEAAARSVSNVQQALANIRGPTDSKPPYPVLEAATGVDHASTR